VRRAIADSDIVLVVAGSARGGRDHTAAVLARCGELVVRGVALRPAHPVLLAASGTVPVVGVPGYPVSAALTVERFVAPVLERLLGAVAPEPGTRHVILAQPVLGRRDAEVVVPLALEPRDGRPPLAWPLSRRGGALFAHASADATLVVAPGAAVFEAGEAVLVTVRP
jgi:putative molybdopterin biosynthesis protein